MKELSNINHVEPVILSRCIDYSTMLLGHGPVPILGFRSGREGPSLEQQHGFIGGETDNNPQPQVIINQNTKTQGILKVSTHTPMYRSEKEYNDDSSLETIGDYERDSAGVSSSYTVTPRHVSWEPGVKDPPNQGCSMFVDYIPDNVKQIVKDYSPIDIKEIIDKISDTELVSKLESGVQRFGKELERMGMNCAENLAPRANFNCGLRCDSFEGLGLDTEEGNDLIDHKYYGYNVHPIEDAATFPIESRDDVVAFRETLRECRTRGHRRRGRFTFDEHKCTGKSSSSMGFKHSMNIHSATSSSLRDNIETGRGETICITSPRKDPSTVTMRNYQMSSQRVFPSQSPSNTAAVHVRRKQISILKKNQVYSSVVATPKSPTSAVKPIQCPTKPPASSTTLPKNKKLTSSQIICGLKKTIKFMSIGIKSNMKKSYPKRILTITKAYPERCSE